MKKIMPVCRILLVVLLLVSSAQHVSAQTDSVVSPVHRDTVLTRRIRVNGYRVQVYYGGNDQKSKLQARNMAERVKIWFDDLSVYTGFSSPHWICRVGDFRTRQEAMEVLQLMRESGRFPKAIIVKSKINITENELRREEPEPCREEPDSCRTGITGTCKADSATVG